MLKRLGFLLIFALLPACPPEPYLSLITRGYPTVDPAMSETWPGELWLASEARSVPAVFTFGDGGWSLEFEGVDQSGDCAADYYHHTPGLFDFQTAGTLYRGIYRAGQFETNHTYGGMMSLAYSEFPAPRPDSFEDVTVNQFVSFWELPKP